jgi:hypothetical protein
MSGKFDLDDVKAFLQTIIVFVFLFLAALAVFAYELIAGT